MSLEKEMICNRLTITGDIDCYTPKIVLEEIVDSLGIKCDSLSNTSNVLTKINKNLYKNKIVKDYEKDTNSLRIIARYVNTHSKNWKRDSLLKAFHFLSNIQLNELPIDIQIFGLQTPDNIYSLNACILYRLCKDSSILTNFNNTLEDMARNLKIYFSIKNSPQFRNFIQLKIHDELRFNTSANNLVNIVNCLNIETNNEFSQIYQTKRKIEIYNYEEYDRCAEIISNLSERREAKNDLEAIVMTALYEKIDITNCEDPLIEYELILKKPYFPNDIKLIERMRLPSDSLQNPQLDKNFNPSLPENMYSNRDLIYLVSEEGIEVLDDGYYTALQLSYLTESFVHGKQGNIRNAENTFLEKIEDIEYDQIVIYGIRKDYQNNQFRAYTYGELTDTFSNYKRFIDPITNEIFTDEAIEKLYLLTQKDKRNNESDEIYRERLDLGEEIERVKIFIKSKNDYVEEFLERYENLENLDGKDGKKKVELAMYNLLHTSMYMRNWDGKNDYPLTSESTNFDEENQIIVDDRVTQSLIDFENSLEALQEYNNLGHFIINLPLMQYHAESKNFVTSNDESEGLTIKDRIRIVRGGENEGLNSCIRLSSNKFCATSYFYMILLGFRLPFSISEVSHIF
jgi:hypothetical protein